MHALRVARQARSVRMAANSTEKKPLAVMRLQFARCKAVQADFKALTGATGRNSAVTPPEFGRDAMFR
jgi:hypothetical protein